MNSAKEIAQLSRPQLRQLMLQGHGIDPADLAGWAYHGVSLGLPRGRRRRFRGRLESEGFFCESCSMFNRPSCQSPLWWARRVRGSR